MKQLKFDELQMGGMEFLRNHKNAIINLFTGLGKTDTFLQYLCGVTFKNCCIIVPKSVAIKWSRAIEQYFLNDQRSICVMTFGTLKSYVSTIEHADIVCIDEPKLLKNQNNHVFQLLNAIPRHAKQQRVMLDATVIENNLAELDAIMEWFNLTDKYDLLDCIFPKRHEKNVASRRVIWKRIKIPIPTHKKAVVKFSEMDLASCLIPKAKSKNTVNAAIYRALDCLNAVDTGSLGKLKIDTVIDIINAKHQKDAGIICVTRKEAMEALCDRLWKAGYKAAKFHGGMTTKARQDIIEKFEVGAVDWVVATKAGERGLNMSRGNVVFHFDLPWSGSSLIQRDRVTRRDSDLTKETNIYVVMFEDTVEELVYQKVKAKIAMNRALNDDIVANVWTTSWKDFLIDKWRRVYNVDLLEELK